MKRTILLSLLLIFVLKLINAQVAVNITGDEPDAAAMLDVSSETKGFLPPRMTIIQRDQIANPPAGLMVYNTDDNCINFFNGVEWMAFGENPNLPSAVFYATPKEGFFPLTVSFNDLSTNSPTQWLWDFGDGGTSTLQNPTYVYHNEGIYSVTLTVTNAIGTNSDTKVNFIIVDGVEDGSPCPDARTVLDIENNSYNTVLIGSQCWMKENLKVGTYPNGDEIPYVSGDAEWSALTDTKFSDAYCYYDDSQNESWGALYTYSAAIGDAWQRDNKSYQGVCPDGWHLPSEGDWNTLESYLIANGYNWDGTTTTDKAAKSVSSKNNWNASVITGAPGNDSQSNNATGFSVLPAGYRDDNSGSFNSSKGSIAGFWSNTLVLLDVKAVAVDISKDYEDIFITSHDMSTGHSVRCIKDVVQLNPPSADFSSSQTVGEAPLYISFSDLTSNSPTSWLWEFGDGGMSTNQNPSHYYSHPGIYTVSLTATNSDGSHTETKVDYIEVKYAGGGLPCPGMPELADLDGNIYHTVQIGSQCWMKENLKVTKYPDGTAIPNVTQNSAWDELQANNSDAAYCFYDNDENNGYGVLYTYAAAIAEDWSRDNEFVINGPGAQGICPDGWHLPTDGEWTTLTDFLGGAGVAGGKMKESGYIHWTSPNNGATNSSGFSALPSGNRSMEGVFSFLEYVFVSFAIEIQSPFDVINSFCNLLIW